MHIFLKNVIKLTISKHKYKFVKMKIFSNIIGIYLILKYLEDLRIHLGSDNLKKSSLKAWNLLKIYSVLDLVEIYMYI